MIKKERLNGALVMGLLWVVIAVGTYFFRSPPLDNVWLFVILLLTSLLCVVLGLMAYLGDVRVIAGYNMMTERERTRYNIDKITLYLGALCVVVSYALFLIFLSLILFLIAVLALTVVMIAIAFGYGTGSSKRL